jgi:hypothetical protein
VISEGTENRAVSETAESKPANNEQDAAARPSRRGIQFGLLELLLLTAVIAAWLPVIIARRQIPSLETEIQTMRLATLELIVTDDQQLSVRTLPSIWHDISSWKYSVPPGADLELRLATEGINSIAFPADYQAVALPEGEHSIHLKVASDTEGHHTDVFVDDELVLEQHHDREWLASYGSSSSGDVAQQSTTYPLDQPLKLKVQRYSVKHPLQKYQSVDIPNEHDSKGNYLWISPRSVVPDPPSNFFVPRYSISLDAIGHRQGIRVRRSSQKGLVGLICVQPSLDSTFGDGPRGFDHPLGISVRPVLEDESEPELPEEARSIDRLLVDWSESQDELQGLFSLKDTELRRQKTATAARENEATLKRIAEILSPEQHKRLNQLALQRLSFNAFIVRDPVVAGFMLDKKQMAELRKLRSRRRESRATLHEAFLELLEPAQRSRWDELVGKPFFTTNSTRIQTVELPSLRSPASSMRRVAVQQNLTLNEQQLQKIRNSIAMWQEAQLRATEQMLAGAVGEERDAIIDGLKQSAAETSDTLIDTLSPAQSARLDQLVLQLNGVHALVLPEVAELLALDRQQEQLIAEIRQSIVKRHERIAKADDVAHQQESPDEIRQRYLEKGLEVLTPVQRKTWDAMVGELVDLPANADETD